MATEAFRSTDPGSIMVLFTGMLPNRKREFVNILVDVWKLGLKDCFGRHGMSEWEWKGMLREYKEGGIELLSCSLKDAQRLVKHGLRIAEHVGTPLPPEFDEFSHLVDLSSVDITGSLYKCFKCGKGELSDEQVAIITQVAREELKTGVAGTPDEEKIYFVCEACKR